MGYEKIIEIYKIEHNINSPLASDHNQNANCSVGDYLVIIDNDVWIKDNKAFRVEQFAKASYSPQFVRNNTTIFTKIA